MTTDPPAFGSDAAVRVDFGWVRGWVRARPAAWMILATWICIASASVLVAQQQVGQVVVPAGAGASRPESFVGTWRYNSEDSRNLATGRPERGAPGSVPPRTVTPRPAQPPRDGDVPDRASPFAAPAQALRENRDLSRDLLEIAETLSFVVTADAVGIIDDLGRERTYPTDSRRGRYRLGASAFNARVRWEEGRLIREIEGQFGFRMTETYFLSPDGARLFLIIRVGTLTRGRVQAAVNRVYDRVTSEDP